MARGPSARRSLPRRRLAVLPGLPPLAPLRRPDHAAFPIGLPGCTLHAWGRHALWHGLRAAGLGRGAEVLAPAWHHGSEIEVLARLGVGCRFYECRPDLEPDAEELESLLGPATRALYLTHYLGLPRDAARWRAWAEERDLLLIEDVAQGWLGSAAGRPLGSFGHVAIFCLYKSFGLPDGGACVVAGPDPVPDRSRSRRAPRLLLRRRAAWLAQRMPIARVGELDPEAYSPQRDFALGDPELPPAAATLRLLRRVCDPAAARRRRENYERLLAALAASVPEGFAPLPDGAAPFAFPLRVADKRIALDRLRRAGVIAMELWSVPHPLLPADAFPGASRRRSETIALPVHQELGARDVSRLISAARAAVEGAG